MSFRRAPRCTCRCPREHHHESRGRCAVHYLTCLHYEPAPPQQRRGGAAWKALGR